MCSCGPASRETVRAGAPVPTAVGFALTTVHEAPGEDGRAVGWGSADRAPADLDRTLP